MAGIMIALGGPPSKDKKKSDKGSGKGLADAAFADYMREKGMKDEDEDETSSEEDVDPAEEAGLEHAQAFLDAKDAASVWAAFKGMQRACGEAREEPADEE